MKQRSARKVQNLAASTQRRLTSYALAAAAAGVSVLALTGNSEGEIVYKPTHRVIGNGAHFHLDLTGDGTTDLTIENSYHHRCTSDSFCSTTRWLSAKMADRNKVVHNVYGVVALKPGVRIGPGNVWLGGAENMAVIEGGFGTGGIGGSWVNVNDRYVGVKFTVKGETHYGWARLNVQVSLPFNIITTLTGYAYETTPDKAIVAGRTKGPEAEDHESSASPRASRQKPASLGSLALGASGLSLRRSEENATDLTSRASSVQ